MTTSAGDAHPTSPSPNLKITVADHIRDPEARRAAERLVTAHVARNRETADRQRSAEAERARMVAAAGAPLRRLLDADPAAAAALRDLRVLDEQRGRDGRSVLRPSITGQHLHPAPSRVGNELAGQPPGVETVALAIGPPYDISWSWFHEEGSPPGEHIVDPVTGIVRMRGTPGDAGFVSANGGFGVQIGPSSQPTFQWWVQMTYSGFGVAAAPAPGDIAKAWAWMRYEVKRGEDETISQTLGAVFDLSASGPFGHSVGDVPSRSGFVQVPTDIPAGVEYTLLVDLHIDAEIASPEGGASASTEAEWRVGSMGPL